jgi:hypothetical protein
MSNSNNNTKVSSKKVKTITKKLTNQVNNAVKKTGTAVKVISKKRLHSAVVNAQNKNVMLKKNKKLKTNVNKLENTANRVINNRVNKAVKNVQKNLEPKVKVAVKAAVVNGNPRPLERLGMAMESAGGLIGAAVRLPFNIVQRGLNAATGRKRNYNNRKSVFGHARNVVSHTGHGVTGLVSAPFKLFSKNNRRRNNNNRRN